MVDVIMFFAGLAIGSFLNVLIDRIPKGESIVFGRSKCDYCRKTLRWFELIPIMSFFVQGGKCRRCHKRLSVQYPLVEFTTAIMFVGAYHLLPAPLIGMDTYWYHLSAWLGILSATLVIVVADYKYQIIPDGMLIVLFVAAFAAQIPMSSHVLVVAMGTGVVSGVLFYTLWLLTRGRGMGFGDVKLAAVLGVSLGFPRTVIAFYTAFLTGALYGVILMIQRKAGMKSRVAFGPFLLLGAGVSVFWSEVILHWWGFI